MTVPESLDHLRHARVPGAWVALAPPSDLESAAVWQKMEQRKEIALHWRSTAQTVAKSTNVIAAAQTARFLETSCWLGLFADVPLPGPFVVRAGPEGDVAPELERLMHTLVMADNQNGRRYQQGVCLVPFLEPDRHLTQVNSGLNSLAASSTALFQGGLDVCTGRLVRNIFLPQLPGRRPLSDRGKGISLLYQAHFAMRRDSPDQPGRHSPAYWEQEADLIRLQADLMAGLALEPYREILRTYLDALHREGDLLEHPEKLMNWAMRRRFRQIFGRIGSEELHLWGAQSYRDAIRVYLGGEGFIRYLRSAAGPLDTTDVWGIGKTQVTG